MTHEFEHILNFYSNSIEKKLSCVLATIVELKGSSYRKPGVRMLFREDGLQLGAISGGCVEKDVWNYSKDIFKWSSLYETDPYEVSSNQPNYINTLLLINSASLAKPSIKKAKSLLNKLKQLEVNFGRNKKEKDQRWISRCLDLDIIWWNDLYINDKELTLPHPRFMKRNFVISPLAEVLSRRQTVKKLNHPKWVV